MSLATYGEEGPILLTQWFTKEQFVQIREPYQLYPSLAQDKRTIFIRRVGKATPKPKGHKGYWSAKMEPTKEIESDVRLLKPGLLFITVSIKNHPLWGTLEKHFCYEKQGGLWESVDPEREDVVNERYLQGFADLGEG